VFNFAVHYIASHRTKEVVMKKSFSIFVLLFLMVSLLTAAAPVPNTTFTVLQGLPEEMNVGDVYTVVIQVESDQPFVSATAMPSFFYPGKGVVAVQGGDRAGSGTSALLSVTFKAKSATARMTDGVAPVHVVVGARYQGGYVVMQDFLFNVKVP
jgi:hypothetical protein